MSERMERLLQAAAELILAGGSPNTAEFIRQHGVNAEELFQLNRQIGRVVLGYVTAPRETRTEIDVAFACERSGLDPGLVIRVMGGEEPRLVEVG